MEYKMFIDGQWVDSESGETMDIINPATQEVVAPPLADLLMWKGRQCRPPIVYSGWQK